MGKINVGGGGVGLKDGELYTNDVFNLQPIMITKNLEDASYYNGDSCSINPHNKNYKLNGRSVYRWNNSTKTWTSIATISIGGYFDSVWTELFLYVGSGEGVEVVDLINGTVTKYGSSSRDALYHFAVSMHGKFVVMSGYNNALNKYTVNIYNEDCTSKLLTLNHPNINDMSVIQCIQYNPDEDLYWIMAGNYLYKYDKNNNTLTLSKVYTGQYATMTMQKNKGAFFNSDFSKFFYCAGTTVKYLNTDTPTVEYNLRTTESTYNMIMICSIDFTSAWVIESNGTSGGSKLFFIDAFSPTVGIGYTYINTNFSPDKVFYPAPSLVDQARGMHTLRVLSDTNKFYVADIFTAMKYTKK